MLSNLTQHDNSNADQPCVVPILLKKKRATLSSDKLNIPEKQGKNTGMVADMPVPSETPYRIAAQNCKPKFHEDFDQSHSGLSPPSA